MILKKYLKKRKEIDMKKIVSSILLLGSLTLVGCNNNNETPEIRKQRNNEEITYIDTNLNFTNYI